MRAVVTGVTGQDGHYLSQLLDSEGYEVFGIVRHTSSAPKVPDCVRPIGGDITDPAITKTIADLKPDEIYNLAAMSHVGKSFECPVSTFNINAVGAINVLEAARQSGAALYQASTSELFGIEEPPQNELTPFHPRSPYGVAKAAAFYAVQNYREAYDVFACNGILFNHESPLRGHNFVTQKVCTGVARIFHGLQRYIELGNLDATRDWGHAEDYVRGMWLMLQQDRPDDYVLATGESHSIRELVEFAFGLIGIFDWKSHVIIDDAHRRPSEVPDLRGDPSKAEIILHWKRKYDFEALIIEMVEKAIEREKPDELQSIAA